jgi:Trypsin-like peptidase domain
MDTGRARQLFYEHASAMAYVAVERRDGTHSIASAFHVGEGVFVTSRHVVEGNTIREVKITESLGLSTRDYLASQGKHNLSEEEVAEYDKEIAGPDGTPRRWRYYHPPLEVASGPHFAREPNLDVAAFRVRNIHPATGVVKLGVHFDDWVYRAEWRLSDAIVLGYPPVPMVNEPTLIAAKAEIHTHVVPRHSNAVHFLLSATPRGGFSGGVAIYEDGNALGVVTSSLIMNYEPEQLGFFAVLSVEAIVSCLIANRLYPEVQRDFYKSILGIDPVPIIESLYPLDE